MTTYYRPLAQIGPVRPKEAVPLAGTPAWFTHAEIMERGAAGSIVPVSDLPDEALERLASRRADIAGVCMDRARIMGILNVTPDSFSDGGTHNAPEAARAAARKMIADGAEILDIGGESTRPGAVRVADDDEIARTAPVIAQLKAEIAVPISIDTRKSRVAKAALDAGAALVNDVSGLTFDSALAPLCAARDVPVCIMHSQGTPDMMQDAPEYDNVLLDVYDFLEGQIQSLENAGLSRSRIMVDPGIGFGKTQTHNIALLQGLSLFHGLGCAILLGVSRKGFIGKIGHAPEALARAPGSIAVALDACRQGAHILRVHDVDETRQALALWRAVTEGL